MQTNDIPTHEWVPFLDEFSQRHLGQPVTVEVLSQAIGVQREAVALPLVGVSVDLKDDSEQIDVIAGDSPHAHVMHAVPSPVRVQLARDDDGRDQALQLISADGTTTLVRLESLT